MDCDNAYSGTNVAPHVQFEWCTVRRESLKSFLTLHIPFASIDCGSTGESWRAPLTRELSNLLLCVRVPIQSERLHSGNRIFLPMVTYSVVSSYKTNILVNYSMSLLQHRVQPIGLVSCTRKNSLILLQRA